MITLDVEKLITETEELLREDLDVAPATVRELLAALRAAHEREQTDNAWIERLQLSVKSAEAECAALRTQVQ